jgi:hypothetical protein
VPSAPLQRRNFELVEIGRYPQTAPGFVCIKMKNLPDDLDLVLRTRLQNNVICPDALPMATEKLTSYGSVFGDGRALETVDRPTPVK